ncbi:hypothetical protein [Zooshikella harenae]|uniref:Zinc-ribbon domain-containing protein n=1 Tax=Zooshikella harenae TaxID=2827238 RepID=A0ABS5ZDA8_9GAMM|nr:hypothetical protein [Zooshikella harenae]MBU2712061.1 hypothetical protein [Zooshikella harenae]
MILIWGTKPTDQKLGFVAEICPECNSVNKVSVHRIGLTGHFFWVPVGRGQFVEAYGTCTSCNKKFSIEITDYETIDKKDNEQIEDLIRITNPKLGHADESLKKNSNVSLQLGNHF